MSYVVENCCINPGFQQQFSDLLLLESRSNVQRSVTILPFIHNRQCRYNNFTRSVCSEIYRSKTENFSHPQSAFKPTPNYEVSSNDVLFIAGLVAYWPARIHDVALLDLYCPHVTSGRLAVCYSQIRSILSSATAFPAATLR